LTDHDDEVEESSGRKPPASRERNRKTKGSRRPKRRVGELFDEEGQAPVPRDEDVYVPPDVPEGELPEEFELPPPPEGEAEPEEVEGELGLPQKRVKRAPKERKPRERPVRGERARSDEAGPPAVPLLVGLGVAVLATFVLTLIFTHFKDFHWSFWFILVVFIAAALFELDVKGGGEIGLGTSIIIGALFVAAPLSFTATTGKTLPFLLTPVQVIWIFFLGTIVVIIVRALDREATLEQVVAKGIEFVGVGIATLIFWLIYKIIPKKPLFHGAYWPGLIAALVVAAVIYFFFVVVESTFILSKEGNFPAAVYFQSFMRRSWYPFAVLAFIGGLFGFVYRGIGMWSSLFVLPLLLVVMYAYNRVAATDQYLIETIRTLASIPEETGMIRRGHAERVANLSAAVARELGLSPEDVQQVEYAAYLHDIGAITKQGEPGLEQQQLTEVEGVIAGGVDIIGNVDYLDVAAEILHGREGLRDRVVDVGKRRAVSMGAGILRAVDDFEGLLQGRDGREPLSENDALTEMNLERGVRYDSKVLRAIARVASRMPMEESSPIAEGSPEGPPIWREPEG
jgi:hypothetical protein